jgi:hypothetical protein
MAKKIQIFGELMEGFRDAIARKRRKVAASRYALRSYLVSGAIATDMQKRSARRLVLSDYPISDPAPASR